MTLRTGTLAAISVATLLTGSMVAAQAAELNFLDMLFGARPQPQAVPAPSAAGAPERVGAGRQRLRTRFAALPVKVRIGDRAGEARQTPIDMKDGAVAAFLKDETLRPGDIVILKSGAHVFRGDSYGRHALHDFEPAARSAYLDGTTRRHLADLIAPAGALPKDAARRLIARAKANAAQTVPASAEPAAVQAAAMRVINPWDARP